MCEWQCVCDMCAYLEYEVGDEGVRLVLGEVIVLCVEHGEQQFQILQHLHQDCGVGVEEAEGEPLQNNVQTANGGFTLTLQSLSNTHIHRPFPQNWHTLCSHLDMRSRKTLILKLRGNMNPHRAVPTSIITPIALTLFWKSKWKRSSWSHLAKQVDIWVLSCSTYSSRGVMKFHFKIYKRSIFQKKTINFKPNSNIFLISFMWRTASVRRMLESGTFSCFSSLILCSFALGMKVKMGPVLSSSSFEPLAAVFLPAAPWERRQHRSEIVFLCVCISGWSVSNV